ncbi:hypothetical protein BJ165DRAFT_381518 [Panaeolus papilionaceus]|nr:hypothetical protein BJ165DRAFT_381518 [Panaeolus papilionaceus]
MDVVFVSDASALRIDRVLWFTAQVTLVYDYILTIDKEVEHVWPCPWSWGVILFYINRYIPFVELSLSIVSKFHSMTLSECAHIGITTFWFMVFGNLISTVIVVMRTYALWSRKKVIKWVLTMLVVQQCTYSGVVAILTYGSSFIFSAKNIALMKLLPFRTICPMPTVSTLVSLHYIGLLGLVCLGELLIVCLILARAKDHLRGCTGVSTSWIKQLYRNALSIVCILMSILGPPLLEFSLVPHQRVFHSIFCNRMLFLILRQRTSQRVSTRLIFTSLNPLTEFSSSDEETRGQIGTWEARKDRACIH